LPGGDRRLAPFHLDRGEIEPLPEAAIATFPSIRPPVITMVELYA